MYAYGSGASWSGSAVLFHYASVASFDDIKMMEVVAAIDSGATQSVALCCL